MSQKWQVFKVRSINKGKDQLWSMSADTDVKKEGNGGYVTLGLQSPMAPGYQHARVSPDSSPKTKLQLPP